MTTLHTDAERELIAVLEQAQEQPGDDGYLTYRELRAKLPGLTEEKLRIRLRDLAEAGRLEVLYVPRLNLARRIQPVPGYRLVNNSTC